MSGPVLLPDLRVELDGEPLAPLPARSLTGVLVRQSLSLPALCELTFVSDRAVYLDDLADAGASLVVRIGGHNVALFNGEVTALETRYGPDRRVEARLRGYDALHRLRKRQSIRSVSDMSVEQIAGQIAAAIGVDVQGDGGGPLWSRLVQWQQSDLEFLVAAARRVSRYVTLREDGLHLLGLDGVGEALDLKLGDGLREVTVEVNADSACAKVTTLGWNPWLAADIQGVATHPVATRDVAANARGNIEPGERLRVNEVVQSEAQAIALAQTELDRRVAGEIHLTAVAAGDPALRPGQPVKLSGLTASNNGRYCVTTTTHSIDRTQGFVSRFETAPPAAPEATERHTHTALGDVSDVDDPDELGRVRITLPSFDGIESDWFEVLVPGAGPGKGCVSLPDVGDRVLVLLLDGDPGQGIVLGGLYADHSPEHGVVDGTIQRFTFHTRSGQKLCLSDDRKEVSIRSSSGHRLQLAPHRVRLANDEGSCLEMTHDKVSLHSERDMDIDASGRTLTLRAAAIEFETG